MEIRHLIVTRIDTAYIDYGAGPTALFLHGWGADASSFDEIMARIGNYRCISLSLPGFGETERPRTVWSVSDYAEFVRNFILKLGITEPDVIIAHSFGGRIAIKGTAMRVLKPKKLVLIASAGTATKSVKDYVLISVIKIGKILAIIPPFSIFKNYFRRMIQSKDYASAGPMRKTFVKILDENLLEDARKISVSTLIIWGENDTETPLIEAHTLHKSIQNSRLEVIPNAGHFVHQEKSEKVADLIKSFI